MKKYFTLKKAAAICAAMVITLSIFSGRVQEKSAVTADNTKYDEQLDELKKQVRAEAKEIKKAADEQLELHDVEREMRHDRIRAEAEHHDTVRQMKKDVEAEARDLKKLLEEK